MFFVQKIASEYMLDDTAAIQKLYRSKLYDISKERKPNLGSIVLRSYMIYGMRK